MKYTSVRAPPGTARHLRPRALALVRDAGAHHLLEVADERLSDQLGKTLEEWLTDPRRGLAPHPERGRLASSTTKSEPRRTATAKGAETYPLVSTSGPEVAIESRSFDHDVDELVDVPIGPFLLRYWQGRTRPTTDGLALRLAGCQNTPVQITALS